ncbi:MAG: hypothetical protein H7832_15095 [Magnetococcus sp. DMHC-6]
MSISKTCVPYGLRTFAPPVTPRLRLVVRVVSLAVVLEFDKGMELAGWSFCLV